MNFFLAYKLSDVVFIMLINVISHYKSRFTLPGKIRSKGDSLSLSAIVG